MMRREFLYSSAAAAGTALMSHTPLSLEDTTIKPIDIKTFNESRKFADLPLARVAYIERGHGPAALFIHGYSLNGYQWRGALDRLQHYRRCIAPDVMSFGHTQAREGQTISPETQVEMLALLLDSLHIESVDLIGNDSGGLVAQLFVARHPTRVRTLLLTNCDVDENSPPPMFVPLINIAKQGALVDKFILPQLNDKQFARSSKGFGQFYTHPGTLTDELIETYFRPIVETPLREAQFHEYTASFATNPLLPIRDQLRQWKGPARMVWGLNDPIFPIQSAEWLDKNLPGSRGVRRIEGANLFFPEEMPDIIAEEALTLWNPSTPQKPVNP